MGKRLALEAVMVADEMEAVMLGEELTMEVEIAGMLGDGLTLEAETVSDGLEEEILS